MSELQITPEIETIIRHLETARAAEHGIKLEFDSQVDLEIFRRKIYSTRRKLKDAKVVDFSDIIARVSDTNSSILLLIKEESHQ